MNKQIVVLGAVLVALGIVFGALGAHALAKVVDADKLLTFETGVRYQIYHGLAFIILGASADRLLGDSKWSVRLMFTGVLLFSVSLYFLVLQYPLGVSLKFLGPVTPLGGILMIAGWGVFIKNLLSSK